MQQQLTPDQALNVISSFAVQGLGQGLFKNFQDTATVMNAIAVLNEVVKVERQRLVRDEGAKELDPGI